MSKNLITHHPSLYILAFLPFVVTIIGNLLGGYWLLSNCILFISLIALDSIWKVNKVSKPHSYFIYGILVICTLLQVVGLGSFLWAVKIGTINLNNLFPAVLSNGLMLGMGITIAGHELIHSKPKWAKNLGILSLFLSLYTFHYVEHIQGHHKHVAQEIDPTSAKLNQDFYNYFFVGFWVELYCAFKIEAKRLNNKLKNVWGLSNFVVRWSLLQLLLIVLIAYFITSFAALCFVLISFVSIGLHYIVMYSQHYGLTRDDGDKTLSSHSWQNNSWISEYFFLGFINHSEHHTRITKGYSEIVQLEISPDIGTGYFGIIPLVLIPPIWIKKTNRILK